MQAFQLDIYYQDAGDPDRLDDRLFIHREVYHVPFGGSFAQQITKFSYNVMYLLPATSYIIVIAATSDFGPGPGTRTFVTTPRTGMCVWRGGMEGEREGGREGG